MKKILFAIFGCFVALCAHAAQIVNVDYIHKIIQQEWDVTVPIRTNNIMAAANMKYLLTAIDVANEILNGEKTTDYGNGEFATLQAADTIATNQAVETLVRKEDKSPKFFLTTTSTNSFSFKISAAGKFYVDWGDGKTETITKPDTTDTTYSHNYDTANTYTIGIGGQATAYNTDTSTAAISFSSSASKIVSIDGSLGAIFGTLSSDTNNQPRFCRTFYYATNMTGSIPANLFAGISGAPTSNMFEFTFYGCSGLTGAIPDGLFGNLTGAPASSMFYNTFYGCSGLTSIPENLFGNISGTAQTYMFYQTFSNCTSLTGPSARINGQYLYEIWPNQTQLQVGGMYKNATGLSDYPYIPVEWGGLGATTNEYPSAPSDAVYDFYLTTTSDTDMFAMQISAAGEFYIDWGDGKSEWITKSDTTNMTFGHKYASNGAYNIRLGGQATAYNTSTSTAAISFYLNPSQKRIASIDGSLGAIFGTLSSGTNKQPRFSSTFYNATNMTGSIPENLFAGISGKPASYMFSNTFYGCSGLTSIPSELFAGISGEPASYMFDSTFDGCKGLTGAIPAGLFAGISGATAAERMFSRTFSRCSGLTSIPENLFAGISGAPARNMFYNTFSSCSGLTSIPENLFGNISGTAQRGMFKETFYNCTSLTGPSARINGQYLYEIWPDATSSQVSNMYSGATGLSDYACIPTVWGGGGEDCSAPTAKFTLTTTDDTDSFSFSISAAGEFVVDWGDGTVETITKPDTTDTIYSHNYDTAGAYTIGFSGQATAYNTDPYTAAIRFIGVFGLGFDSTGQIASIDGSLGAIFGTLLDATEKQPRFYETFYGAYNMTGSIPENLFAGISGAPASNMFNSTFSNCSGLTGAIPDGLFGNLTGAPASGMFSHTFHVCSGLTGAIPDGLFAGISGAPASNMFDYTFYGCSGLTSIPENLFGNISGTAQSSMFNRTFYNCTSLTGPSARINGQYLYEIWPSATTSQVNEMYYNATGLSDYSNIPSAWK